MLQEVDKINWKSLEYPDMPVWIKNLASSDQSIRRQALDNLYDNRVIELSNASPYVIQFLVELLMYEVVKDKEEILNILFRLASEAYSQPTEPLARKVLDSITLGTDIYIALLKQQHLRGGAFKILGYLKQKTQLIMPELLAMLDQEEVRAAALYSIYELLTNNDIISDQEKSKYIEYFSNLLQKEEDEYVQLALALILSNLMKKDAPKEVVLILKRAITYTSTEKREYASSAYKIRQAIRQIEDENH